MPCAQAETSGLLGPLQSPNWVKVYMVSTVFFLPVSILPGVEKCLGLSIGDGYMSAEPDCRFLQVCLLFHFTPVPHEQAPIRRVLKTELSAWQGRSAGPGSSGLDQFRACGVDRESVKMAIFPIFYHSPTGALQQYLSSVVGTLKAIRNREGSGVTIWVSDVDSSAAIFHSLPVGVDMSPDIVGNMSAVRANVRFLSSPGSCSFEVMPGTLRNVCMSAFIMAWCMLDSSLYWRFRLWHSSRFMEGCARLLCRGREGSLLSISPWMRI